MLRFSPEVIPGGDGHQDICVLPQMFSPQVRHQPRNHKHMRLLWVYHSVLIEYLHDRLHCCGRWYPKPRTLHLMQVEEIILRDLRSGDIGLSPKVPPSVSFHQLLTHFPTFHLDLLSAPLARGTNESGYSPIIMPSNKSPLDRPSTPHTFM